MLAANAPLFCLDLEVNCCIYLRLFQAAFDDASEAFLHCQHENSGGTPANSAIYCAICGTIHYLI